MASAALEPRSTRLGPAEPASEARVVKAADRSERPPILLGHRGDARCAPENTLAALAGAMAAGVDGVEFDVRSSRDGIPVLSHDADLVRLHGLHRRVDALTAAELDALGLPSLADALAAIPRRAFLDVELKEPPTRLTVEVLAAGRGPELARAVVSSFDVAALARIRALAPSWPRWLNVDGPIDEGVVATATDLECAALSVGWRAIDERVVRLVRPAGLELAAWTVQRRATVRRLARLGVLAICVEGAALASWEAVASPAAPAATANPRAPRAPVRTMGPATAAGATG